MSQLKEAKSHVKKTTAKVAEKVDIAKQRIEGEVDKAKAEANIKASQQRNKKSE